MEDADATTRKTQLFAHLNAQKTRLFERLSRAGTEQNTDLAELIVDEIKAVNASIALLGVDASTPQTTGSQTTPPRARGDRKQKPKRKRARTAGYAQMTADQKKAFGEYLDHLRDKEGITDPSELQSRVHQHLGLSPNLLQINAHFWLRAGRESRAAKKAGSTSNVVVREATSTPSVPPEPPASPLPNGVVHTVPKTSVSDPSSRRLSAQRSAAVNALLDTGYTGTYGQIRTKIEEQGITASNSQIRSLLSARTRRLSRPTPPEPG